MSADIHAQKILILDFGSQYTQLIARRVREAGVYSEIRAFDMTEQKIREYNPRGVILSGGPESVSAAASPRVPACVFELGVPVLGMPRSNRWATVDCCTISAIISMSTVTACWMSG